MQGRDLAARVDAGDLAGLDQRDPGAFDHADDGADKIGSAGQFAVDGIGEQQTFVGDDIDEAA